LLYPVLNVRRTEPISVPLHTNSILSLLNYYDF
jgi:hypothetical protein